MVKEENTGEVEGHETVAASPNNLPESAENIENQKDQERSKNKEGSHTLPFYKLFSFADSSDYLLMFMGTICAAANGVCMPLLSVFLGRLVNAFGEIDDRKLTHQVSQVCLNFLYLAMASCVVAFAQVTCWVITGERQTARIRTLYLEAILRQDIGFFDKETHTGEIVERMSGDTVLIQDAMGEKVGKFIQLASTFVGGFIIAFTQGWLLTLIMLSSVPLTILSGAVMTIVVVKLASRGQAAYSSAADVVEQTVSAIRTVASFTGEKQAVAKYDTCLAKAYKAGVQQGFISGLGFGTIMLIVCCNYALAIWFGGKLILEKDYSGGRVINILFAVLTGSMSLGQASPCLSAFASGQAAAYKMFETIERKPDIDANDATGRKLENLLGSIEFKDVYFSYPSRPYEEIFHGFNLSIPSGTTAALVGESGSGKSTIISLIQRFYDPQAGEVLIDGFNLKDFQLKWIREMIGLVSQEPVLFGSSIKDNITYGKDGATVEEIRAAAMLANATKFIDKLPHGLDTMVGEQGTHLSGGQKQRVAIARAILKDPRILLLDEATSALDAESEKVVQEALDRMMVNRTTVIVAHRLTTVRNADVISVIHQGKIVEKGKHSDLIKDENGAYSKLIRLQQICTRPESNYLNDPKKSDLATGSGRYLSQRISFLRSISHSSSGNGNSSRHSFTLSVGFPTGVNELQTEPTEYNSILKPSTQHPNVPFRRVANLHKPEILVLVLGTLAAAASGSTMPVMGVLLSSAIKSFFEPPHELREDTSFWALMYIALGGASLLTLTLRQYLFYVAGCKLVRRIRLLCFDRVVHMEVGWFDEADHSSGEIGGRLSADAAAVRGIVGDALGMLVQNLGTAAVGLTISFATNWQLSLVVLALVPFIGMNGYFQMKFLRGFSASAKKMYEEASQIAKDAVGSIRTVVSFCAEEKVMQLYKKKCEGPMRAAIKQGMIGGMGYGLGCFCLFSVYGASFYAGARLVAAGEATFPQVFRVFFCLAMTAIGVAQSGNLAPEAEKAKSAVSSVFAILDRRSRIDSSDESGTPLENISGKIEFINVCFKYPARPNVQIFQDLCLLIHPGKTVALVGESGSGKSTVISLLQRFYDPDSGEILLDGCEIRKLQVKWLRQQMGLVSQEPVLFNDTVKSNIAYGKEGNATEAEITSAAELANAHRFISSLQKGYETVVGERGVQLSGGQKQRVAIARAIVKAPKILLLDEATSALDAESERVVQEALDRVMVERTTIVVAHRLSTIKGADLIAVVKNGGIAEKGTHETLMNIKDGIYASLVALNTSDALQ